MERTIVDKKKLRVFFTQTNWIIIVLWKLWKDVVDSFTLSKLHVINLLIMYLVLSVSISIESSMDES